MDAQAYNQNTTLRVEPYFVDILFENYKFRLVEALTTFRPYVLVGGDILNEFEILLDGRSLQFEVME